MIKGNDPQTFQALLFLGAVIAGSKKDIDLQACQFSAEELIELAQLCHTAARAAAPQLTCSELLKMRGRIPDNVIIGIVGDEALGRIVVERDGSSRVELNPGAEKRFVVVKFSDGSDEHGKKE